jgi:hypothetical protein
LTFAAGVFFALNPALILYEHLGYEILTAFGLTLTVFLFSLHDKDGRGWALIGGVAALALTTLTRSSYHPALLVPVIALACAAAARKQKMGTLPYFRLRSYETQSQPTTVETKIGERPHFLLAASVAIALVPLAWCAKNEARFGFFGTSSWGGQNIWKIASLNHEPADM